MVDVLPVLNTVPNVSHISTVPVAKMDTICVLINCVTTLVWKRHIWSKISFASVAITLATPVIQLKVIASLVVQMISVFSKIRAVFLWKDTLINK